MFCHLNVRSLLPKYDELHAGFYGALQQGDCAGYLIVKRCD